MLDEMRELHCRKAADYGRGADPFANVRAGADFGVPAWVGVMIRAGDKMHRIKSFLANGSLKNESVEDSLKDLAAYALIALVLYRESHGIDPAAQAAVATPDLSRFWSELSDWSQATFGTDAERGPAGPLAHLSREVAEVQADPGNLTEYADLLFLVFDACRRAGFTYEQLVAGVFAKLAVNRSRAWGKPDAEGVCEHVRGSDG